MIKNAVQFTGKLVTIVEAFDKRDANYWEKKEVGAIRSLIKRHYLAQQSNRCCYCDNKIHTDHARGCDVDHIIPKSLCPHFLFEPENLAAACIDCNKAKSNSSVTHRKRPQRFPRDASAYKIVHPHFDEYGDHISVVLGCYYSPRTEKGKFTVIECDLLRFALKKQGWDESLAREDALTKAAEKLLDAPNDSARRIAKLELMIGVESAVKAEYAPHTA